MGICDSAAGAYCAVGGASGGDLWRAGVSQSVQGDLRRDRRHAARNAVLDVAGCPRADLQRRCGGADCAVRRGVPAGLAKHDNFFAASGDYGSRGHSKQAGRSGFYSFPTVWWPASSPYVVAVGGTQLQYGWTWNPISNDAFTDTGDFNPDYWQWTDGGNSEAVWNESWLVAPSGGGGATGGGASVIYPRPPWQQDVDPGYGDHRLVPDTAWNAAVNGSVDIYITAYPEFNCADTTGCWTTVGGTSAASPQTAGLVALVNAARASAGKTPIGFLSPVLY